MAYKSIFTEEKIETPKKTGGYTSLFNAEKTEPTAITETAQPVQTKTVKRYVQSPTNAYASIPFEKADPLTQYKSLSYDDIKNMKSSDLVDLRRRAGLDKGEEKEWYSSFMAGVGDLMTTLGSSAELVGKSGGLIDRIGENIKEAGKITQSKYTDYDALQKLGEFDWSDLKDASWWQNKAPRMLPFTMSLIPTAIIGGSIGTAVAGKFGLGALTTSLLGATGATIASRPAESLMEAGNAYEEAKNRGLDEEKSQKVANDVFWNNVKQMSALDIIQMLPFIKNIKGIKIGDDIVNKAINTIGMGTGVVSEGFEEVLQNKIVSDALGDKFDLSDPETKESFISGVIMGGMFQGAGGAVNMSQRAINNIVVDKLSNENKKTYTENYDKFIKEGETRKDSEVLALNEVAKKDSTGVSDAINEAVNTKIDELKTAGIEETASKQLTSKMKSVADKMEVLAGKETPAIKLSQRIKEPFNKISAVSPVGIMKEITQKPIDFKTPDYKIEKNKTAELSKKLPQIRKEIAEETPKPATGFSTHYEKIKEEFGLRKTGIKYERMSTKRQFKKSFDYASRFPKQAMQIAYGLREAPSSINPQAIRQSIIVSLKEKGKIAQASEIARLASKGFTEAAQTLNLAKADLGSKDEMALTQDITNQRLLSIGEKLGKIKPEEALEVAKKEIKTKTIKATKEVLKGQSKMKESTIKELDELIDNIICK